jgi:hypothetical protein
MDKGTKVLYCVYNTLLPAMRKCRSDYLIMMSLIAIIFSCVKPYEPSVTKADNTFLVVDGVIMADSGTTIKLSRTRSLTDTGGTVAEKNAQVFIEDESGTSYNFSAVADGQYQSENSSLTIGTKYRLKIITSNGKQYLSDYVEMKSTPPIDSVEWNQNDAIFIYVNTHDPTNNTRFYRWDFVETSDYSTPFDSYLDFRNGAIIFLDSGEHRSTCYKTFYSNNILIATSSALSNDVITHQLINRIPNDNSKISDKYSILVKQYAIDAAAYQYWNILKQNSEQTGGLFDPQPSQLKGNIHCVDVPGEPVMGYISASAVSETRIFIRNNQLKDRKETIYSDICKETFISPDSAAFYLSDGSFLPAYFITNGPLAIAPKFCVDCRVAGGVTARPSFW